MALWKLFRILWDNRLDTCMRLSRQCQNTCLGLGMSFSCVCLWLRGHIFHQGHSNHQLRSVLHIHIPYHTIYMETIPYTCSNTWKPMCVWSNHGGIGFQHLVKHTVCGLIVVAHVPSPFQNLASLKHDACSVFQLLAPCCQCIECAAECWKQGFACPNKGITFASTWKVFAHMPKTGTCPFAKYWKPYIHNIPLYVYIYIYILYYI